MNSIQETNGKPEESRSFKILMAALAVSIFSMAIYLPALDNDFVNWDDYTYIHNNSLIHSINPESVASIFTSGYFSNWIPLTLMSHALDYTLWELNPAGHHLTSIVLHGLNSFMVVVLTWLLVKAALTKKDQTDATETAVKKSNAVTAAAVSAGILFGSHPLHVESVVWISERKDLLYAFFWFISVLFYILYVARDSSRGKVFNFTLSLVFFAFSLMSKPMAVTLPVVLIILDFYPLKRFMQGGSFLKIIIYEKVPFFILGIAVSIIAVTTQKRSGTMNIIFDLSFSDKLWTAFKALSQYLVKTFLPLNLNPLYLLPPGIDQMSVEYLGALVLITLITALSIAFFRKAPWLFALWGFYIVTLLPVLGFIKVGNQEMADRYMYISLLGPVMPLALLAFHGWNYGRNMQKTVVLAFAVICIILSVLTVRQTAVWENSFSLWEYTLKKNPQNFISHNNLGNAYSYKDMIDKSIVHYNAALEAMSAYPAVNPIYSSEVHYNLAGSLYEKGKLEQSAGHYKKAVDLNAGNVDALNNLGVVYFNMGLTDRAIQYYHMVLKEDPGYAAAYLNLGEAFYRKGLLDESIKHYTVFLGISPGHTEAHYNLAMAYKSKGLSDKAVQHLRSVAKLDPDYRDVQKELSAYTNAPQN